MSQDQCSELFGTVAMWRPEKEPNPNNPAYLHYVGQPTFMTNLAHIFNINWHASVDVALDEALCKFTGKSHLCQFRPDKPAKNGLEIWKLSSASSYCFNQIVNMRQGWSKVEIVEHITSVIPSESQGSHILYIDAGYGSDELAIWLHELGFHFTIAAPKNQPTAIFAGLHSQLQRGETAYCIHDTHNIIAFTYYSSKQVNMFTNIHDVTMLTPREEKHQQCNAPTLSLIPEPVLQYRQYKNLVDCHNHHVVQYSHRWPWSRWHFALTADAIQQLLANAWICWKFNMKQAGNQGTFSLCNFLYQLNLHLAPTGFSICKGALGGVCLHWLDGYKHWMRSKSLPNHACCAWCGKSSKTGFICSKCPGVSLHQHCFENFHTIAEIPPHH